MGYEVTNAQVAVFPVFNGFRSKVTGEVSASGKSAGKAFENTFRSASSNTAPNLSKLKAEVRSAAQVMSRARLSQADADGKVRVAEARLAESIKRNGQESSKTVAAQEQLAAAQRRAQEAADKSRTSADRLKSAQTQLAAATTQAGQAGVQGATRYANGWEALRAKLSGSVKDSVRKASAAGEAEARRGGERSGSAFAAGLGKLTGALAGLAIVSKITGFIKSSNDEARESQKVNAITARVIKTTGGAAKVTAAQVGDLATALSNKIGVDDEAIQHSANLLLTFKNVRNEVGKGNQIFNRATAAAQDLAAAGFGSADSAAKMLGKALNDPVKGMTALGRAGVTFTDAQKKQIKAMVESGNLLGAQKIIMAEVESQVGGAAAASATAAEKLTVKWANFKELIGTKLVTPAIDALAPKLGPLIDTVSRFVTVASDAWGGKVDYNSGLSRVVASIHRVMSSVGGLLTVVGGALSPVKTFFTNLGGNGQIATGIEVVLGKVTRFVKDLTEALSSVRDGGGFLDGLATRLGGLFSGINPGVLTGLGTVLGGLFLKFGNFAPLIARLAPLVTQLGGVFRFLTGPVGIIATLFTAAYATSSEFRDGINGILGTIGGLVAGLAGQLLPVFTQLFQQLLPVGQQLFTALVGAVAGLLPAIGQIVTAVGPIIGLVGQLVAAILPPLMQLITALVPPLTQLIGAIATALVPVLQIVAQVISTYLVPYLTQMAGVLAAVIKAVIPVAQAIATYLISALTSLWQMLGTVVTGVSKFVSDALTAIGKFASGAGEKFDQVVTWVAGLPKKMVDALGDLGKTLYDAGSKIIAGLWDGLKAKWKDVTDWFGTLATWIKNHKGPIEKDRRLLIPHGLATMGGYAEGLERGLDTDVKAVLTRTLNVVAGTNPTMTGQTGSATAGSLASGASLARVEALLERLVAGMENGQKIYLDGNTLNRWIEGTLTNTLERGN